MIGRSERWTGGISEFLSILVFLARLMHVLFRQVFSVGPRRLENSLVQAEKSADANSDFNALIAQRNARRVNTRADQSARHAW